MKHKILALGVTLICMLSLAACGNSIQYNTVAGSRYDENVFSKDGLMQYAQTIEDSYFETMYLQGITPENFEEQLEDSFDESTYDVFYAGYKNWYDAIDELGFQSKETIAEDISVKDLTYYVNKDGELMVDATIQGTGSNAHTAVLEYSLDRKGVPTLISVNVNHSLGEKLRSAGLNTLLGMGMAFTVLIIIALVISAFPLINKITEKKPESAKEIAQKSMDNVTSQIAEKEELSDDAELIAVISAAIAAYEGSSSAGGDGFVVRSVRKVGKASNWKKA
ncbi:OadG family protein [Butyrivibrio sp. INlla16]|uniref:OadG family protein n=1 Tax=Butyrivibrio sp. INlla16 TaxID=1520807 RepID=UPI000881174A|nr:OadG family protein [Butyrivibrio sp. INlla16]SDB17696.1 sodium pump decarboxylases, gamma subunit [Butyrivibrio sp. INlla16]